MSIKIFSFFTLLSFALAGQTINDVLGTPGIGEKCAKQFGVESWVLKDIKCKFPSDDEMNDWSYCFFINGTHIVKEKLEAKEEDCFDADEDISEPLRKCAQDCGEGDSGKKCCLDKVCGTVMKCYLACALKCNCH